MNFDWNDLAFSDRKKNNISKLYSVFIAAPRDISIERITQLIKTYLPHQNITFGFSKEQYVEGFEDQPQFKMLPKEKAQSLIDKVNSNTKESRKIYTIDYFQRELPFILQDIDFTDVILVRGSWKKAFHTLPSYYILTKRKRSYTFVSPFVSEKEAHEYESEINHDIHSWLQRHMSNSYTEAAMLDLAHKSAKLSFDYIYQTGVVIGRKATPKSKKYSLLLGGYNKVVPYQTYAMHHGNSREDNFSPYNDLNHYDTVHAEVNLVLWALRKRKSLKGTTMFINLMPCPTCARMLTQTEIEEFVYQEDHSNGYAIEMLTAAGKKIRRVV